MLRMQSSASRALLVLCLLQIQYAAPAADNHITRPNVLLIVADDLGSVDLNCYGSKDLSTPNLDRLAQSGVRFTQMLSAYPVCTPARGALLTGRYPQLNGATSNGRSMHPDEKTIADVFTQAGYKTALIGKWHLGDYPGPTARGFGYFFGFLGGCIENYFHDSYHWDKGTVAKHDLWRNTHEIFENGIHFGELIVRESCQFLEQHRAEPFFLEIAFNNPHYPVQPLPRFFGKYREIKEPRRSYAAFVSTMDDQIGRILNKLDELNLRQNTIIVFLSDHGHSVEKRNNLWLQDPDDTNVGGGNAGPYRGHKFTVWDGGIRVVCLASWPGHIPAGEVRNQTVCNMDWLPTFSAWCGAKLPDHPLTGTDIRSIIAAADAPAPDRVLHWWMMENNHWAVRDGNWKLVHEQEGIVLSDMLADVTEEHDLSSQYPDVRSRLEALHAAWVDQVSTGSK